MRILSFGIVASLVPAAALAGPILPGLWENSSTVLQMDMPGMPPEMQQRMTRQPRVVRHCVTPEDAARGPAEAMRGDRSCRISNFTMAGGHYRVDMRCPQMRMHSEGSFTPTSYSSTGTMVGTGGRGMTMRFRATGRRIGPCPK